jgi:hypothetical protein
VTDPRHIFSRARCSMHIARCTSSTCSEEEVRGQSKDGGGGSMTRWGKSDQHTGTGSPLGTTERSGSCLVSLVVKLPALALPCSLEPLLPAFANPSRTRRLALRTPAAHLACVRRAAFAILAHRYHPAFSRSFSQPVAPDKRASSRVTIAF